MKAEEILKKVVFNDHECSIIYRRVILLFELTEPDDNAFNLYDDRIQNYLKKDHLEVIPLTKVDEVDTFCRAPMNFYEKYPSGICVFSHNSRNQLRQLIRHMRNAFSHGSVSLIAKNGRDYFEIKALDTGKNKIKLFGIIPRDAFEELWNTIISTITFKKSG